MRKVEREKSIKVKLFACKIGFTYLIPFASKEIGAETAHKGKMSSVH